MMFLFVTDGTVENNNTFHDAVFSGNGTIKGNNTYHNLTFTPNYVYTLTSGKFKPYKTGGISSGPVTGIFYCNLHSRQPLLCDQGKRDCQCL
jgi:hypothetical protein